MQALYFCKPFREKVLDYKAKNKRTKETLLTCLADLFYNIATQKKKTGTIAPKKFIARLRKENGKFKLVNLYLNYSLNILCFGIEGWDLNLQIYVILLNVIKNGFTIGHLKCYLIFLMYYSSCFFIFIFYYSSKD